MGTRGLYGFYYRGRFYLVYNHYDSYPTGLGADLAREICAAGAVGIARWKEAFDSGAIVIMDEWGADDPTPEQVERLRDYMVAPEGNRNLDWYLLLRRCQGSIERVIESGHLLNNVTDNEPDWQEYAYVVNLDTSTLDFYDGERCLVRRPLSEVTVAMFDTDDVSRLFPSGTD